MRDISGKPWARADLFFLNHTLRHGMAVEEVAGFLGRDSARWCGRKHANWMNISSPMKRR